MVDFHKVRDVLLSLIGGGEATGDPPPHPALSKARRIIETRLAERIRIGDLAGGLGLSHNQLTRIFKKEAGLSVIDYIRSRRAARARHLLLFTTRPIKSVAVEVGLPDLQRFNKFVHREWGLGPRELRRRARRGERPRGAPGGPEEPRSGNG